MCKSERLCFFLQPIFGGPGLSHLLEKVNTPIYRFNYSYSFPQSPWPVPYFPSKTSVPREERPWVSIGELQMVPTCSFLGVMPGLRV